MSIVVGVVGGGSSSSSSCCCCGRVCVCGCGSRSVCYLGCVRLCYPKGDLVVHHGVGRSTIHEVSYLLMVAERQTSTSVRDNAIYI